LPSIWFNRQVLLIPRKFGFAIPLRELSFLCSANRHGHARGGLKVETAEPIAADHVMWLTSAHNGDDAEEDGEFEYPEEAAIQRVFHSGAFN
jgi:hypothetical protein